MATPSRTTFISFRRIRYHEASFVYRDLMFSGAVPWLSDHCITTEKALDFLAHPERLEPVLLNAITASDFAVVLADEGYFQSAWTRLEFEQLIRAGLPTSVACLEGFDLPEDVRNRLPDSMEVHRGVGAAVAALCRRMETTLVPFAGQRLSYLLTQSLAD